MSGESLSHWHIMKFCVQLNMSDPDIRKVTGCQNKNTSHTWHLYTSGTSDSEGCPDENTLSEGHREVDDNLVAKLKNVIGSWLPVLQWLDVANCMFTTFYMRNCHVNSVCWMGTVHLINRRKRQLRHHAWTWNFWTGWSLLTKHGPFTMIWKTNSCLENHSISTTKESKSNGVHVEAHICCLHQLGYSRVMYSQRERLWMLQRHKGKLSSSYKFVCSLTYMIYMNLNLSARYVIGMS